MTSSFKTARTSVPVQVKTSQSTNSLSLRNNQFQHDGSDFPDENSREFVDPPEDEEDIFWGKQKKKKKEEKKPEKKQPLNFALIKAGGSDPDLSIDDNNSSFFYGAGSFVSSTPLTREIHQKKKRQSDSPDSRASDDQHETAKSTQQVVYRKGQPFATKILLIYEDTRREVVQEATSR